MIYDDLLKMKTATAKRKTATGIIGQAGLNREITARAPATAASIFEAVMTLT
jgi:hypothetical protein